jgi:hypothetical protein
LDLLAKPHKKVLILIRIQQKFLWTKKIPLVENSKQNSKENIQNKKFFRFFLWLLVTFDYLDLDPDSQSGSTDPIASGF